MAMMGEDDSGDVLLALAFAPAEDPAAGAFCFLNMEVIGVLLREQEGWRGYSWLAGKLTITKTHYPTCDDAERAFVSVVLRRLTAEGYDPRVNVSRIDITPEKEKPS
jgi:hypothetical protein